MQVNYNYMTLHFVELMLLLIKCYKFMRLKFDLFKSNQHTLTAAKVIDVNAFTYYTTTRVTG